MQAPPALDLHEPSRLPHLGRKNPSESIRSRATRPLGGVNSRRRLQRARLSKFGASALIPLSQEFVQAGAPDHSYYQTPGEVLYNGVVVHLGQTTELLFYCFGATLWYYLFYKSRYVPRVISLFGLTAVSVALVGLAFQFLGLDVSIFVFLPILPFELTIGAWLMLRGIKDEVPGTDSRLRWGAKRLDDRPLQVG